MLRYFKNHFGMVMSIIISLILSLCMASVATFLNAGEGGVAIETLISNWGAAFLVIMLATILLPSKAWGDALAFRLGLKEHTLPFGLVANIIPNFIYNTAASLMLVGCNVGFSAPYYWAAFWKDYWVMYAVSYVLSLLAARIGISVASRACMPAGQPQT